MTTVGDKLTAIYDTKSKIRDAIINKGGYLDEQAGFSKYPQAIYDLPVVTPTEPSNKWAPNPTWWDVKGIMENHVAPEGYVAVAIFLLAANSYQTPLKGWDAYRTSDGAFYTNNIIHVWDTTKDKECDEGYKTRYLIVYEKETSNRWLGKILVAGDKDTYISFPFQMSVVINCNMFIGYAGNPDYFTLCASKSGSSPSYQYPFRFIGGYLWNLLSLTTTSKGKLIINSPCSLFDDNYGSLTPNLRELAPLWDIQTVYSDLVPDWNTRTYRFFRRMVTSIPSYSTAYFLMPRRLPYVELHVSPTLAYSTKGENKYDPANKQHRCIFNAPVLRKSTYNSTTTLEQAMTPSKVAIYIEADKIPAEIDSTHSSNSFYERIDNKIGLNIVANYNLTGSFGEHYIAFGFVQYDIIDNTGGTDIWVMPKYLYMFTGMSVARLTKLLSYLFDNQGNATQTMYITASQNEFLSTTAKLQIAQKNWTISICGNFNT